MRPLKYKGKPVSGQEGYVGVNIIHRPGARDGRRRVDPPIADLLIIG